MFGKLLKHEFRRSGRVVPIIFIIGAAIIGSAYIFFAIQGDAGQILRSFLFAPMIILAIGIPILTLVVSVVSFGTSSYGNAGYLTRTLPVPQRKIFDAKSLSAYIWLVLSFILSAAAVFTLVVLIYGTLEDDPLLFDLIKDVFDELFSDLTPGTVAAIIILAVAFALTWIAYLVVLVEFCFTAGNQGKFRKMGFGGVIVVFLIVLLGTKLINIGFSLIPVRLGLSYGGSIVLRASKSFTSDAGIFSALFIGGLLSDDALLFSFPFFTFIQPLLLAIPGYLLSRKWYGANINIR